MKHTRDVSLIGMFISIMIVGAYIQITLPTPFFVMHITLQFFVSILCGLCLPFKKSSIVMLIYILMGLCGLPVFASGGGMYYIMKPTFGFVLGFLFCTMTCSLVASKRKLETNKDYLIAGLMGLIVFYLSGNIYYFICTRFVLQTIVPLPIMFFNCFIVSIVPDTILCVLASNCSKRLRPIIGKMKF